MLDVSLRSPLLLITTVTVASCASQDRFPDLSWTSHKKRVAKYAGGVKQQRQDGARIVGPPGRRFQAEVEPEEVSAEVEAEDEVMVPMRARAPRPTRPTMDEAPPIPTLHDLELFVLHPLDLAEASLLGDVERLILPVVEATAAMQTRIEAALNRAPQQVAAACYSWPQPERGMSNRLRTCSSKQGASRQYDFMFELGRQREDGPAMVRTVVSGQGRIAGGLNEGVVRFDFDATRALTGEGAVGIVEYAYRIVGERRKLTVRLVDFAPDPTAAPVSSVYEYNAFSAGDGRVTLSGYADLIRRGEGGRAWYGSDGTPDKTWISVAWEGSGAGRVAARSCLGDGTCAEVRECWQPQEVSFFGFGQRQHSDLGWAPEVCPAVVVPPMKMGPDQEALAAWRPDGGDGADGASAR